MWRRVAELGRSRLRWLALGAVFAIAPKCFLCLAAYAGIGVALGLSGPEMCGGSENTPGFWPWTVATVLSSVAAGVLGILFARRRHHLATTPTE